MSDCTQLIVREYSISLLIQTYSIFNFVSFEKTELDRLVRLFLDSFLQKRSQQYFFRKQAIFVFNLQ